jgi:DnaJ-domain-containing protein 1
MRTAITCPHCEVNNVEVAKEFWFLYGFLLLVRYGSKTVVGCQSCVQGKGFTNLFLVLLFGWWCFPWGLGTPFVLIQNIIALAAKNDEKLIEVLNTIGVRAEDVVLGSDGLTPEQRALFDGVVSILTEAVWADGSADPREVVLAVEIAANLLDGSIRENQLREAIMGRKSAPLDVSQLNAEMRLLLFHVAIQIVAADNRVDPGEARFLHDLGARLELPGDIIEQLFWQLNDLEGGGHLAGLDPVRSLAFQVLGIPPDTSAPEAKRQYRKLSMQHHPDRHANNAQRQQAANDCMTWLNWSYQTVLRGRTAGAPPGETPPDALMAG